MTTDIEPTTQTTAEPAATSNEDGGSGPTLSAQTDGGAGASSEAAQETSPNSAPRADTQRDTDGDAYQRLAAQARAKQTGDDSASPSNTDGRPPETPAAGTAGDPYAELDPGSRQALQRMKVLPSPEVWKAMPSLARANLVREAKHALADRDRQFQQQQAQPAAPEQTATESNGQPTRQAAPAPLAAALKTFAERYGGGDEAMANDLQAILDAAQGGVQQQVQQAQRVNQFLISRLERQEEKSALKQLAEELPPDVDVKKHLPEIKTTAGALLRAHWNAGNQDYSYEQALVDAGRTVLATNVQQQAQRKLLDRRGQSLRGSPERGTAVDRTVRTPRNQDEYDSQVYQQLAAKAQAQFGRR